MEPFTKNQIRQNLLQDRNNFTASKKINAAILKNFIEYSKTILKFDSIIAGYYPIGSEFNILPILEQLSQQSFQIVLPIIEPSNLTIKFYSWTPQTKMIPSKYTSSILEPLDRKIELVPSIVIVPIIGCDLSGNRIGSGKGMYDKSIAQLRTLNPDLVYIGICYDLQLLETIPTETHDQKLDIIITETRIIKYL